ncbi:MAG TPA: hypothetical protein VEH84_04905 [Alphaproteobacteria bacterium]|nr:hypothetical protein [Alphaproteobacteria bacterium]
MRRSWGVLAVIGGLALASGPAAAQAEGEEGEAPAIGYLATPPLLAGKLGDVPDLLDRLARLPKGPVTPVDPDSVPFFQNSPFGLDWLLADAHRAIVIGQPAACPYDHTTWGYFTRQGAAAVALHECLDFLSTFKPESGEPCQCRLAAIDDVLLVEPQVLAYRELLPAWVLEKQAEAAGGARMTERFANLRLDETGREEHSLTLYDQGSNELCQGNHSPTNAGEGTFTLACIGMAEPYQGTYKIIGGLENRPTGIARGTAEGRDIVMLFNFPSERLRTIRQQIVDGRPVERLN